VEVGPFKAALLKIGNSKQRIVHLTKTFIWLFSEIRIQLVTQEQRDFTVIYHAGKNHHSLF
jgi:hypothetical protein